MEKIISSIQEALEPFEEYKIYVAGGGILFILLLIIIFSVKRSLRKKWIKKHAPELWIQSFQIAPLGRDAYLKIKNTGQLAELKDLRFLKRYDLKAKENYKDYPLEKDKIYGLFLEAAGKDRIEEDFGIELYFEDQIGNEYKQVFNVGDQLAKKPKLTKYATKKERKKRLKAMNA